ncbi:hypothetical protein B9Z55_027033 [Caenorhabditis nigoni]|nr:hypothetical protein B9Z55_027033 [Caenorhabditis nigoni]
MSTNLINENHRYLRTCILYEVLQKIPIFDSYRSFCDAMGKDAMEYRDFEFWYYRFYHGNRTLLRSMNHTIKAVVDSIPIGFGIIQISVSDTSMSWWLDKKYFSCCKKDNGCTFVRSDSPKVERSEECYMKRSLKYLNPLFKIPNLQVDHFSLDFDDEMPDCDDLFPVPLNAKSVYIDGDEEHKVVHFLSAMTPGYLKSISLDILFEDEEESYGMIFKNEQFKQAKSVSFSPRMEFNMAELEHFSHLKRFKCLMWTENPLEDIKRIRDTVSTFKELESCELECRDGFDNSLIADFAEGLGEQIPIGPLAEGEQLSITHRYQIPESNDCLEFKIKETTVKRGYRCLVNIVRVR